MHETYDVSHVRSLLPVLSEWTYLNTGTVGVMPQPVLDTHLQYIADYELGGHPAQSRAVELADRSKETLANLLNVPANEIAFNRNATDGINFVAAGFPLASGDEVITTTEEHPAMVIPWLAACERAGATLRFVDVSADVDEFTSAVRTKLTDRTRLVTLSQVSCETGTRIPVEALRGVVGDDVAILVDASQSVGQFTVDILSLSADFVIGNGHKWLAGPKGTGFAWFKPESIHLAPPAYFASDTVDPHWSRVHYQQDPAPGIKLSNEAARYEFGTRSWHLFGALHDAIAYQADLGWEAINAHVDAISSSLKANLSEIEGVTVLTPDKWEDSSGIVTFSLKGWNGVELSRKLWDEYRIAQRRVEAPSSVRVSCSYFTNEDDCSRLLDAVSAIAGNS